MELHGSSSRTLQSASLDKRHHSKKGFRNPPEFKFEEKTITEVIKWVYNGGHKCKSMPNTATLTECFPVLKPKFDPRLADKLHGYVSLYS